MVNILLGQDDDLAIEDRDMPCAMVERALLLRRTVPPGKSESTAVWEERVLQLFRIHCGCRNKCVMEEGERNVRGHKTLMKTKC